MRALPEKAFEPRDDWPMNCPSCRSRCTLSGMTPEQADGLSKAPETYRLCPLCRGIFRRLTSAEKFFGTLLLIGLGAVVLASLAVGVYLWISISRDHWPSYGFLALAFVLIDVGAFALWQTIRRLRMIFARRGSDLAWIPVGELDRQS